jgi:TatD DNase family protein
MRLYDVHAHLADARLDASLERILRDSLAAGVQGILACAARLEEWDAIVSLSRRPGLMGALGLHPFFVDRSPPDLGPRLRQGLASSTGLVAVGEVGLDFWQGRATAPAQLAVLAAQLEVARDLALPVVLHNRRSWSDFFGLLRDCRIDTLRGVCHCFNGSRETARAVLDRGLMVSFGGPITYPTSRRIRAAAAYVPLESTLTETDCPDLPPEPCRGGVSLPWHVRHVVDAIAAVKGLSPAAVAEQVETNFTRLLRRASPPIPQPPV